MVLTGDSLLVGDVGRPDFGGGDAAAPVRASERLLRLPDWVAVFPRHFEGPCGKGMCGRPSTTIGFERLFNPLARLERDPFIDHLTRRCRPPAEHDGDRGDESRPGRRPGRCWRQPAGGGDRPRGAGIPRSGRDAARCARAGRVRGTVMCQAPSTSHRPTSPTASRSCRAIAPCC